MRTEEKYANGLFCSHESQNRCLDDVGLVGRAKESMFPYLRQR